MEKIKCLKFPKIEQFRNVVAAINRQYSFVELDEHGDAVYDQTLPKPKITFSGTVKLHGTNAGVSYTDKHGVWTQSRNGAFKLSQIDSHMGFTQMVASNEEMFKTWFKKIAVENDIDTSKLCISIFGEWAGKGIQKNVSISDLPKAFYIFGVKVSNPDDPEFNSYWVDHKFIASPEDKIYNVCDFPNWELEIDFNNPALVQNKLIEITNQVEEECPIAAELGVKGLGEGVVWSCTYQGVNHRFKVKGEKHSVSKVKKLAPVDIEKLNSIQAFVDYAVTRPRFEQALSEVFSSPEEYDVKKTGDLMRWFANDIMAEELDVLKGNNLEWNEVAKYVSTAARQMFFKELEIK